MHKIIFFIT